MWSNPKRLASVRSRRGMIAFLAVGVCTALLLFTTAFSGAAVARDAAAGVGPVSDIARHIAGRAVALRDNRNLPFIVIDKTNAEVYLFDAQGQLRAASRALLGLARGDESAPGIGTRRMSSIPPEERTTPAGRFVASMGHDTAGRNILWVDYANAIALHRVVTSNLREHRLERLMSGSVSERRISYGCINVPVEFFERFVVPSFTGAQGIVYILPETRPAGESLFGRAR